MATKGGGVVRPLKKYHFNGFPKMIFHLIVWGVGEDRPCDANLSVKCPYSHDKNTALIKQISLFDSALDKTNI